MRGEFEGAFVFTFFFSLVGWGGFWSSPGNRTQCISVFLFRSDWVAFCFSCKWSGGGLL